MNRLSSSRGITNSSLKDTRLFCDLDTTTQEFDIQIQKKRFFMGSRIKTVGPLASKLFLSQEKLLRRSFGSVPETEAFNKGLESLSQAHLLDPKIDPSTNFDQFILIKQTMLDFALSNQHYKDKEFSPDSRFTKVDSLPPISSKVTEILKSSHFPQVSSLLTFKLPNRPILGPYKFEGDDFVYVSQFKDGVFNGLTLCINESGAFYFAETNSDLIEKAGFSGNELGVQFGHFKENIFNGRGIFQFSDGEVYDGEWKDGKRNGRGAYTYENGQKYTGEWVDDVKHGVGLYEFGNGESYKGEFSNGQMHGMGVYTW